jgi:hypothetical protein
MAIYCCLTHGIEQIVVIIFLLAVVGIEIAEYVNDLSEQLIKFGSSSDTVRT